MPLFRWTNNAGLEFSLQMYMLMCTPHNKPIVVCIQNLESEQYMLIYPRMNL